jgi:dTDP-4-dehydrorhamnose reductase
MKLFIIGHDGMLGQDMVRIARGAGHEPYGASFPDIDITSRESIRERVESIRPDAIINCAAFTAVDACETNEATAMAVNATGAGLVAACAESLGVPLVHISTDYVFDGKATKPYVEDDLANPASVYGRSKLKGEEMVFANCARTFVFRIAWLYGKNGNNFVKTIRAAAQKNAAAGKPLRVVNDQFGTPTFTVDVCRQVLCILPTAHFGLYHATNEGACTWYDFAKKIVASANIPCAVDPCPTTEFPRPAPRPAYSVLENRNLKTIGMNIMQPWEEAFGEFLRE